jgi:peptidyl-tRNA hydrolase, PTH1 family
VKLVAGLGNPGERYGGTRHNVGFEVVDVLAERHGLSQAFGAMRTDAVGVRWRRPADGPPGETSPDVWLVKPLTFMNVSGVAVGDIVRYYDIALADVLIVCDDVNLPLGRLRARGSGSEGGHNGLRSVAEHLGTIDYARLRVGVGRGDERRELASHVLSRFEPEERPGVEQAITRAADAVDMWVFDGLARMMNTFNRAEDSA